MSQRQLQRWHVVGLVEVGKITLKEAGEKIGVSCRQAKRIRRAVRQKGAKGLIHGNVGRTPPNRISETLRERMLELSLCRGVSRCHVSRCQATVTKCFVFSWRSPFPPNSANLENLILLPLCLTSLFIETSSSDLVRKHTSGFQARTSCPPCHCQTRCRC